MYNTALFVCRSSTRFSSICQVISQLGVSIVQPSEKHRVFFPRNGPRYLPWPSQEHRHFPPTDLLPGTRGMNKDGYPSPEPSRQHEVAHGSFQERTPLRHMDEIAPCPLLLS
jgi:hypothetical protein